MEGNKYYVYLHIRLDSGEPFYVGKGKDNRYKDISSRNEYWKNIVKKYGYDIIFLEENLTEKESFEKEIYWIARIGRKDLGYGNLVNMTDGGDGNVNFLRKQKRRYQKLIKVKNILRKQKRR
jgi:CRISPR/Cas system-associated protein Cas5 (RAMP superfamily)